MPELPLTDGQREVAARGRGPLRVIGGFGTGKSRAARARAEAASRRGERVLSIAGRGDAVAFAAGLVSRHAGGLRVVAPSEQHETVVRLLANEGRAEWPVLHDHLADPAFVSELTRAITGYQASFLGAEELYVHAEAAGELDLWEELARFTDRYLAELDRAGAVDAAGALVRASLLLRDPGVLAIERERAQSIVVDDYQTANFAIARLLGQLAGRDGDITVVGNRHAWIAGGDGADDADGADLTDGKYLDEFPRRFGADPAADIVLREPLRRPAPPALRIVDEGDEGRVVAAIRRDRPGARVLTRDDVPAATGREWPVVVVTGATDGRWPAPRPRRRWFDPSLFHGPDRPDDAVRDAAWLDDERRRFLVACTRATEATIVVAEPPVTRFVADLVNLVDLADVSRGG